MNRGSLRESPLAGEGEGVRGGIVQLLNRDAVGLGIGLREVD